MTSRPPCWGTRKIRNINWFGYVWYCTACLNVSTFLITRAQAAGRTHALERLERAPGRKCPAHRRMRCARAAQNIVAGAALAAADGRVGDRLAGGSEAVAGGLVSSVRHVV